MVCSSWWLEATNYGFVAIAPKSLDLSTIRASTKPATANVAATPFFGWPEFSVRPSAIVPAGLSTRRISRRPAATSGHTCIELRLIEGPIGKGQRFDPTVRQINPLVAQRDRVACCRLPDHFQRRINAGDKSAGQAFNQKLDGDAGTETDLEDPIIGTHLKQTNDPVGGIAVHPRHHQPTNASQETFGTAEQPQQELRPQAIGSVLQTG
jgi:hypothetical protein